MGRLTGDLKERTLQFGVDALAAVAELPNDARGWTVAKQLCRAASSIGANVWEADAAYSDADFAHKISIARKEANETQYWLSLAIRAELLPASTHAKLTNEAEELAKILGTIVRKTQEHLARKG
ncbi:MAG: four helix bundle protein [Planctomycetes bacterium]|nr:four helix bundle protein [Planctomycetota bacterium]